MPNVLSYTPPWLSRPSPGASLFSSTSAKGPDYGLLNSQGRVEYNGPTRTLAKRGNEVFTVVDNQIRWSSLTKLKDEWQQQHSKAKKGLAAESQDRTSTVHYRVRITTGKSLCLLY